MTCDCTPETLRIATAIHECTCAPSHDVNNNNNNTNRTISLGDVLCAGRLLVRNWERLNGCFNATTHLDGAMLRTIAEAANGLIGLYESVGVAAGILPALGQGISDRERAGTSRFVSNSPYTIDAPSRAATGNAAVGMVVVQSATYLGAHALDEDEAIMVGREALRHSVLLLGEILHDISKDFEDLGGDDNEDTRAILDKGSTDMLRLLGRINI